MEGWLNKKSGGLSFGFSKKYVRLENYLLSFYSSATDRSSKDSLDLRTCTLVGDAAEPKEPATAHDFQVHAAKKKVILRATNADDKQCWLRCLQCFHNVAAHPNAPIPMPGVLLTGLHACIQALSRDGCVQGIFRESGKQEEQRAIFLSFLRGARAVPHGADVHAVAGALKKLLRELPETLFTNKLFEQVCQANPTPAKVAAIVEAMPKENRAVLTELTELLYLIVCDANTTRMDVKNLAIVLTPNLTRKDQQGVVVPIEPFWQILINNKDSVLYPSGVNPNTPVPATPASRSRMASQAPTTPLSRQPSLANTSSSSGGLPPGQKPSPLTIPSVQPSPTAQPSMSPTSEPAQSPSIAYTNANALASQAAGVGRQPTQQHHQQQQQHQSNPHDGADSLLFDEDGGPMTDDLDSLLQATEGDVSLLEDAPPRKPLAVAAPLARQTSRPGPLVAAASPAAGGAAPTASPKLNVGGAQKPLVQPPQLGGRQSNKPGAAGYGFDDDDDEGEGEPDNPRAPPPNRSARSLVGGARAVQLQRRAAEEQDDDEMDLFGESADGDEAMGRQLQTQTQRNAEAIRQAKETRNKRAQAPVSPTAPAPSIAAASSSAPTAAAAASTAASRVPLKSPNAAMKDSFGFDDSLADDADDGTLGLTPQRKPGAVSGGAKAPHGRAAQDDLTVDGSLEIGLTEADASATFDTPPLKPQGAPVTAAAAPAAVKPTVAAPVKPALAAAGAGVAVTGKKLAAEKPLPPPLSNEESIMNSSFDEDFTLGSELPPAAAAAVVPASAPSKKPTSSPAPIPASAAASPSAPPPPDDLGLSHIATANDTLGEYGGDDASLLSLASDLSLAEKRKPVERKPNAAATKSTAAAAASTAAAPHHPDASLTFGDDTDFDLSAVDDASVKETVYSSKPLVPSAAAASSSSTAPLQKKPALTVDPVTPPPRANRLAPPLSAVRESGGPGKSSGGGGGGEDDLSLSMDDSFSSDAPLPVKSRNAMIAAAAAKARAAKAGISEVAPPIVGGGGAAASKSTPALDDDDSHQFSLDIDSQLNSPPRRASGMTTTTTTVATPILNAPQSKLAAPAKTTGAPAKATAPVASVSSRPPDDTGDNSLDLLTRGGPDDDASLDLLSTMDRSEAPTKAAAAVAGKKPTATTIATTAATKVNVPVVGKPAVGPSKETPKSATVASSSTATKAAASASAASSATAASSTADAQVTAEAALALVKSATATHRSDSEEISRLLTVLRRCEVENLTLRATAKESEDALRKALERAEDAERRVSELTASAGSDAQGALRQAEQSLQDQSARLHLRFSSQLALLTQRAEEAERTSLAHLAAKDLSAQSALDAKDARHDALMRVDQMESTLRSALEREKYLEREAEKKDGLIQERRQALVKVQQKLDALVQSHSLEVGQLNGALAARSAEATATAEKLRTVTSEREELHLAHALALRKLADAQGEIDLMKAARADGNSDAGAGALRNLKLEREREQALHAHDRASWDSQRAEYDRLLVAADEKFQACYQRGVGLEAEKDQLDHRLERAEMATAQAKQKALYLTKALDALEADQQRRLRSVLSSLASRAMLAESLESRLASAEALLEKHAPSDTFSGYLGATESAQSALLRAQEDLARDLAHGSSNALVHTLERFPALRGVAGLANATPIFAQPGNATMTAAAGGASAYQPLPFSPISTARYQSLTARGGSGSGGGSAHGTYRSALEFIPMTAAQGASTARAQHGGGSVHEEKTQPAGASVPSSDPYYGSDPLAYPPPVSTTSAFVPSSYVPLVFPTYSFATPVRSHAESQASTARSHIGIGGGVVTGLGQLAPKLFHRISFDESKRQLMQIEAKTRAGLDASHQRLQAIEDSLQRTQQQAQRQLAEAEQDYASPRPF